MPSQSCSTPLATAPTTERSSARRKLLLFLAGCCLAVSIGIRWSARFTEAGLNALAKTQLTSAPALALDSSPESALWGMRGR